MVACVYSFCTFPQVKNTFASIVNSAEIFVLKIAGGKVDKVFGSVLRSQVALSLSDYFNYWYSGNHIRNLREYTSRFVYINPDTNRSGVKIINVGAYRGLQHLRFIWDIQIDAQMTVPSDESKLRHWTWSLCSGETQLRKTRRDHHIHVWVTTWAWYAWQPTCSPLFWMLNKLHLWHIELTVTR